MPWLPGDSECSKDFEGKLGEIWGQVIESGEESHVYLKIVLLLLVPSTSLHGEGYLC